MAKILVTTADLERAAPLQWVFQPDDEIQLVASAGDVRTALASGEESHALVVSGGLRESETEGLIAAVYEEAPQVPIVVLLGEGEPLPSGPDAYVAVDEYFEAPLDADEVVLVVRRLIDRKALQSELGIVGKTAAVREVVERVVQIAPVGSTVLITGESGTGKELVARGLHRLSPRRGNPFIAVNIAALPETLLESELFGHEKGAFTGANSLRKGMFELANGGTIFLDEVAEMPLGPQTRLLRVLEQREFMRVGGSQSLKVDVRVIAATNRDLRQAVELREFRRDLYYRLDVLHIHLPPLRARREDIPLLVHAFIQELSREHRREFKGIAPEAMHILVGYDWPGNVRELRNLVESMVVLAPGSIIRSEDIPPEVRGDARRRLPTPVVAGSGLPRTADAGAGAAQLPQMEFIFRTLVDLKYDVEDIRREFELYKRRHPELTGAREAAVVETVGAAVGRERPEEVEVAISAADSERLAEEEVIEFRPGMTMEELERAAIVATLKSVGGNRRRASEKLGIGERTLYRKLKEYEIDA
ncbi:MAG: sigma-54-dependent Fis family transcriptional regulator [Gemmatimonadota bacterium]|nr:MAG: sigma-54-dependent Fis family transcriptional regulator [Gemmatimonadota bacterium]